MTILGISAGAVVVALLFIIAKQLDEIIDLLKQR
jgi:hypothetical protein